MAETQGAAAIHMAAVTKVRPSPGAACFSVAVIAASTGVLRGAPVSREHWPRDRSCARSVPVSAVGDSPVLPGRAGRTVLLRVM
jgi:hypothetical protein